MSQNRKKRKQRVAAYDTDNQKGTGLLVDGGNGFYYVVSHIPVKVGISNDREVNPKLVGKMVQFSLDEGMVDNEGHITGVVGNWVGPATDSQKEEVEPYVDPEVVAPAAPPPMPGGMGPDVLGPMDVGLGDPLDMGPSPLDMGPDMGPELGPPPDMIDIGPPPGDMGPPLEEEGLPPVPEDIPII